MHRIREFAEDMIKSMISVYSCQTNFAPRNIFMAPFECLNCSRTSTITTEYTDYMVASFLLEGLALRHLLKLVGETTQHFSN